MDFGLAKLAAIAALLWVLGTGTGMQPMDSGTPPPTPPPVPTQNVQPAH